MRVSEAWGLASDGCLVGAACVGASECGRSPEFRLCSVCALRFVTCCSARAGLSYRILSQFAVSTHSLPGFI